MILEYVNFRPATQVALAKIMDIITRYQVATISPALAYDSVLRPNHTYSPANIWTVPFRNELLNNLPRNLEILDPESPHVLRYRLERAGNSLVYISTQGNNYDIIIDSMVEYDNAVQMPTFDIKINPTGMVAVNSVLNACLTQNTIPIPGGDLFNSLPNNVRNIVLDMEDRLQELKNRAVNTRSGLRVSKYRKARISAPQIESIVYLNIEDLNEWLRTGNRGNVRSGLRYDNIMEVTLDDAPVESPAPAPSRPTTLGELEAVYQDMAREAAVQGRSNWVLNPYSDQVDSVLGTFRLGV